MRSNQVFSAVEGVYNREQYIKKKEELRKCKGDSSQI